MIQDGTGGLLYSFFYFWLANQSSNETYVSNDSAAVTHFKFWGSFSGTFQQMEVHFMPIWRQVGSQWTTPRRILSNCCHIICNCMTTISQQPVSFQHCWIYEIVGLYWVQHFLVQIVYWMKQPKILVFLLFANGMTTSFIQFFRQSPFLKALWALPIFFTLGVSAVLSSLIEFFWVSWTSWGVAWIHNFSFHDRYPDVLDLIWTCSRIQAQMNLDS